MQKAYSGRLYFSKYNYLEFFKHPLVFISGYPAKTENVFCCFNDFSPVALYIAWSILGVSYPKLLFRP